MTIPHTVAEIGIDAFAGCNEALTLYVHADSAAAAYAAEAGIGSVIGEHTPESIPAVDASCMENGLTEGSVCSTCAKTLAEQEIIQAPGHTEVIDAAVPATHLTTGLTSGVHCEACGEVLTAQETLPVVEVPEVVTLPEMTYLIEEEAFAGDITIVCVALPEGCGRLEAGAFRDCAQLRFIEIPVSVEFIDETAFDGCCEDMVIITAAGSETEAFALENGVCCVLR